MINFLLFAFYLCIGATLLIVWPIMLHPTLPPRRKVLMCIATFILLVPIGFGLYALLGVPQMTAG